MADNATSARLAGLDLVRAAAVVAVLLYHADFLSGGLLGVTVFFTLSGFLITGQVWRELSTTGRLDVTSFWSRRIRRLVPPSLITVVAVAALWPALGYHLPAADIVSALLPVRNWVMLASHTAYGASPSPTAHFWSLAVEEQIYLVLPLAVWVGFRLLRQRWVVVALAVSALGSTVGGALLARSGQLDRAYLSTATRLGEVVAGAALAIALGRRVRSNRAEQTAGLLALAALLGLFVIVSWPSAAVSTWAIPAAVGATLVACAAAASPGSWLAPVGSLRPVRLIADHAYELYLVHVPVFALVSMYRTGLTGGPLLATRLGVTAAVAAALHAGVEPVRRRRWLPSPLTLAGTVLPAMLVVSAVVLIGHHGSSASASASAAGADSSPLPPVVAASAAAPRRPAPAAAPRRTARAAAPAPALQVSYAAPVTHEPDAAVEPAGPPADSLWLVGDSTLRELDDPSRTDPTLTAELTHAGWTVTGLVAVRALATCGERPWDDADDDQPAVQLPAVRDVVAEWEAPAPARSVLIQLGSNDLTQFRFSDEELSACLAATIDALPTTTTSVYWVLPTFGPWCWCDVDRAHADAVRFADVLAALQADHPQLHLLLDGLTVGDADPRDVFAEDGVHGTRAGRARRVAALVDQLVAPAS